MTVSAELRDWLSTEHAGLDGSATSVREDDAIAERVATMVRPLRARRAAVGGAVVFHDDRGRPFAAVHDGRVLVRTSTAPAILAVETVAGLDGWRSVDPSPPDIAFRRGTDVLRDLLADAFAH